MKHKPTILKYLVLLICIGGLRLAANSQNPPYVTLNTNDGNKLSIIVPPGITSRIYSETSPANPPKNYYSIWLEKGDGNYLSTFSNGIENIPAGNLKTSPYLLASILYEPRRRPPTSGSIANKGTQPSGPTTIESPQLISPEKIKLFSNVRDIVANDTMVFGISYSSTFIQQDTSSRYKVIFRYNKPGLITFHPITGVSQFSNIHDYSNNSSIQLNNIRTYDDEVISVTGIPQLNNFSNAIAFDNIKPSGNIFNIFISLVPLNDLPETSNIEAELYYQNGGKGDWKSIGVSKIDEMKSAYAHDPNSISVFPRCLSLPQTTQKLHYTINFQNTGEGNANAVKAVFYFPSQMNRTKRIENLKASYSDIANFPLTDIVYDWINGRIIFTINTTDDVLDGTLSVTDPVTNPKTMGQISFDLEIVPGTDVNQSAILDAWAEIYLRGLEVSPNAITTEMEDKGHYLTGTADFEIPIRTNNAVTIYSNCCDGKQDCKCSNPKGIWQWLCCYWWIILIILMIFVIWWLYKRLRRHS